jgi:hypothetical protein
MEIPRKRSDHTDYYLDNFQEKIDFLKSAGVEGMTNYIRNIPSIEITMETSYKNQKDPTYFQQLNHFSVNYYGFQVMQNATL